MNTATSDLKSIFGKALEIESPADRVAYLDEACGTNAGLRGEVEGLLSALDRAGEFMKRPAAEPLARTSAGDPITEQVGSKIGPYKLLQKIGEGGFGIVFMAEQEKPVRRVVALKIIKPGMDTAQVIARFESERQALAMMDHPNIARVLDAGATDTGRPYFVMELVKGVPITEFCDKNHMPSGARLKLFIDVCHAIQHAHHKGVIHRDIKPSNVMVTLHDGVPVVKVIDFGVAKATLQKLTERTLFTAYGQMVGTPAYMSPEQAEMSGLDIDTRSDIYALGVLLYELLTGTTPLDSKRLRDAGYAEMQRLICDEEAPRPSTRLWSLGDSATVFAGNRGLDVRKLSQLLAGDLDWIVMKALEKDRNRRYGTPGTFAEDVDRYLRREAILARPPSAAYRLRKFTQRNRAAVLTAVAFALLLVSSAVFSAAFAFTAKKAKDQASEAEAVARNSEARARAEEQKATAAAATEKSAKEMAEAKEAETRAVLEFVETKVFAAARPEGQEGGLGRDVTLRRALEAAQPSVESSFTKQPLIEARLRKTLGLSFIFLGETQAAVDQFQRALELRSRHLGSNDADTLRSMNHLANGYSALGRHADALKLREETLAMQKSKLGADHIDTLQSMNNLALSYATLGRQAEAMKLYEEALARLRHLGTDNSNRLNCMSNLAITYGAVGRYAEATELHEQTLALRRASLGPTHPDTLASMGNLAISYGMLGRQADALVLTKEALALRMEKLGADHSATLANMHSLAHLYSSLGQHAEALTILEDTLVHKKRTLGPGHPSTLETMWGIAETLVAMDRGSEAIPVVDEIIRQGAGRVYDPVFISGVIDLRLRHFEKAKDFAGCRTTSEMWEQLNRTDADSLYNAACFRAITAAVLRATDPSEVAVKNATAEADRAMAWLQQAIAAGFTKAAQLANDTDLDVLRDREDFKKLVSELESSKHR